MGNHQIDQQPILIKLNRFISITSPSSPTTDFITTILLQLKEWLTIIPNLFLSLIHQLKEWLSIIPNLFLSLIHQLKGWLTTIPNLFLSLIHHLKDWLTTIPNLFLSIIHQLKEWLTTIPNLFLSLIHHLKDWLTTIPNLFLSIIHQLKEWLTTIPNLFLSLLHKLDHAFPPEIRSHYLQIAAVCAAVVAAVVALYFCGLLILNLLVWVAITCCNILRAVFVGLWITCCSVVGGVLAACYWVGVTCQEVCFCCVPPAVVMMKAPGTAGLMIARGVFEAAPQAYFLALRAGQLVVRGVIVVAYN